MRSLIVGFAFLMGCGVTDASSTSALEGTIRLSAYQFGSDIPLAGVEVQFIAPDQSVQTTVTDANGLAEAVSPPNTRVVVFQPAAVRIFDAANPGDHITTGLHTAPFDEMLGYIFFQMSPRPGWQMSNDAGIHYGLHVSCTHDFPMDWSASRSVLVEDCAHATNATAVGWIEDRDGNLLTGASVLRGLDLTANVGETIRMPAYSPKLATASGQFINTPPDTRLLWQTESYYGNDPTAFAYGSTFEPQRDVVNTRPSLGIGDRTVSSLSLTSSASFSTVSNIQIEAGFAASYFVDASASRRMHHIGLEPFNAYTQSIVWRPASDGQPPTMVYMRLHVFDFAASRQYQIELYTPGDTYSVTLPALPPAFTPQLNTSNVHIRAGFYRISNETYSEWLQVHSTRDPFAMSTWSAELPREVWFAFGF